MLHVIGSYRWRFFSRQLRGAESRYTVTELEALAIVESLHHFKHYLLGTSVTVVADHRACLVLLTSSHLRGTLTIEKIGFFVFLTFFIFYFYSVG